MTGAGKKCLVSQAKRVGSSHGRPWPITYNCLESLPLFRDYPPEHIRALNNIAQPKRFTRSEVVFTQGDPAGEMLLIHLGRVKLSKVQDDGSEITLDYRKAGDVFGENMLSGESEYPMSARCLEDTFTFGFNKDDFEQLVMKHPGIGMQVICKLSQQISGLTARLGDMAVINLEDRLYSILIGMAKKHGSKGEQGVRIQFPLTHQDLSFMAGSHRVSVSKAMKKLERMGKVYRAGREWVLPSLTI